MEEAGIYVRQGESGEMHSEGNIARLEALRGRGKIFRVITREEKSFSSVEKEGGTITRKSETSSLEIISTRILRRMAFLYHSIEPPTLDV